MFLTGSGERKQKHSFELHTNTYRKLDRSVILEPVLTRSRTGLNSPTFEPEAERNLLTTYRISLQTKMLHPKSTRLGFFPVVVSFQTC